MPLSLGLYPSLVMLLISSPFCSMCGTAIAGGIKRQRHTHRRPFNGGAFLPSGAVSGTFAVPTPRKFSVMRRNGQLRSAVHAAAERSHPRAIGFVTCQYSLGSGSLSSAPHPLPSPKATKPAAPPRNVAVLARGDSGDDLERCRSLAQELGLKLVVPRREGNVEQGEGQEQERRGKWTVENCGFKFTLIFDKRGRLALDQPGSGFTPLAVDFSGGKTGYRAKHQQAKKEQVVKAAALPKRRSVASTSAAVAATNEQQQSLPSTRAPASSVPPTSDKGRDEDDEVAAPLPLLWDLTAGLGTDSFLLAQAGWRVEMFERSPVVAALVQDALDRARASDDETAHTTASRMSLTVTESTGLLATVGSLHPAAMVGGEEGASAGAARPDVVYLDPMFPQPGGSKKRKSALVKKGMQMLQALLEDVDEEEGKVEGQEGLDGALHGNGGDVSKREVGVEGIKEEGVEERRLFDVAMSLATRKVVVKRPVHGAALVQHVNPSHAVVSKNGRFDVYVVPP